MNTEQLSKELRANHETFIEYAYQLGNDEFNEQRNSKWSPAQQMLHLSLCLTPISKALSSAAFIKEKFGVLDRPVLSYEEIIANYKEGLANGGKAPERFLPNDADTKDKDKLKEDLRTLLTAIEGQLRTYDDEQLNTLILPHPFLGNLSIRELLYVMVHHPLHHLEQVKYNLTKGVTA